MGSDSDLPSSPLTKLYDSLVDQAVAPPPPPRDEPSAPRFGSLPPPAPLAPQDPLLSRIAPLCEVLYLVMVADEGGADEELALRGVVRALSADALDEREILELLGRFKDNLERWGRQARLEVLSSRFGLDRVAAESAFTLSATLLVADHLVSEREKKTLVELAEALGISKSRAIQLSEGLLRTPNSERV